MPVSKNHAVLRAVQKAKAFLHPYVKVARADLRGRRTSPYRQPPPPPPPSRIGPEDIVWLFGAGRTGSTWLAAMMEEMEGQTAWREPLVGALFGNLYYDRARRRANTAGKHFILGEAYKKSWLDSIRTFVMSEANARFPNVAATGGYLVVKEPNGSVGAPLLMASLPESRMVFLIRDPRDVVASAMDAFYEGGWRYESRKDQAWRTLLEEEPDTFMREWVKSLVEQAGNAREAYDAHEGRKALVRYEDLLADAFETMRGMYAELEIPVDKGELARAVEKHAWKNIPEEKKGRGKFYRKAEPGSWKEDLSPDQVALVESMTAPLLQEFYPDDASGGRTAKVPPKASIVIPTLNAGPGFEELLEKLRAQRVDFEYEILVVDSGSTDGTAELARRYGATIYEIPKSEFNHGATRNFGISLSRGEYVVLTVQDAVPLDEQWLSAMVENLERDERVAVVYGRHLPRPEAGLLTRALVNNLITASLERREQEISDPQQHHALRPREKRRVAAFDNVSSCLRRSVWEEFPFEKTNFAEDLRWGKKAVEAGYKIVYEPRSVVIHSHERGSLYDMRRHYVDQLVLIELFEAALVPDLWRLILGIPYSTRHVYRLLRREEPAPESRLRLLTDAAKYAVPTQVGAYLGGKSRTIARRSPQVFGRMDRFLRKGI